jgi:hypothetical protein
MRDGSHRGVLTSWPRLLARPGETNPAGRRSGGAGHDGISAAAFYS